MMKKKDPQFLKKEVVITGFGGQGIIMAGSILGKAAALGDHLESTLVQSYGPESRGGACSAQVVISDRQIYYPYIEKPDILACMSQSAYEKYVDQLKPEGVLLLDQDLVKPRPKHREYFAVPATRTAEDLGRVMMANIIMLGFITSITRVVSKKAVLQSVTQSVPKGTEAANTAAFEKGYDFGQALLKGRDKKASGQTGVVS